jgi:NAD(P)H-dependent FMN reductase
LTDATKPRLHIIICSTRPTRVGPAVANWFHGFAVEHGKFDAALVDLAEVNLPVFNEPEHPRFHRYQHDYTKNWSASVASAEAFAFVTPEYNYGPPPSLLNALNYLYVEWNYKPACFVSYGGAGGGVRAVQVEKLTLTAMKMVPLVESVMIPMVTQQIDANKKFSPTDAQTKAAQAMLDELLRWTAALKPLRT